MSRTWRNTDAFANQSGIAITEFLITFPFIVIMLAGMVDLGLALNRYFTINRVAYEGARFAASIPGLEEGTYTTATSVVGPPPKPIQAKVRDRVDRLLVLNGITPASLPNDYLTTELLTVANINAETGLTTYTRRQVRITIQVPFLAIFRLIGDALPSLRSRVTGPYLYKEP